MPAMRTKTTNAVLNFALRVMGMAHLELDDKPSEAKRQRQTAELLAEAGVERSLIDRNRRQARDAVVGIGEVEHVVGGRGVGVAARHGRDVEARLDEAQDAR